MRGILSAVGAAMRRARPALLALALALALGAIVALEPATAMAAEGSVAPQDQELSAGAIVGIVFSFLLAGVLLMIALPFILPKPPNR
jgi:hypothetical protein